MAPGRMQAQHGVSGIRINQDPLLSFQVTGGVFRWNLREVYDSTQGIVKDHRDALNRGFRYGGDLLLHFSDGFSFGITYRTLGTSHTTPETHWSIPVTDTNGHVIIDPSTGNLLYGPRFGAVSEQVKVTFIGVRLIKEFEISSNLFLGIGIAPGWVDYYETGDYVGYMVKLTGTTIAIDVALDLKYQFDRNWSVFGEFSLLNGSIGTPNYTDPQQQVVNYPWGEPQSVLNWSFNFAIRYTLNRKDKKPKQQNQQERIVPSPSRDSRFQLGE